MRVASSWALREAFVAVLAVNLPLILPLVKHQAPRVSQLLLSSTRWTEKLNAKPFVSKHRSGKGSIALSDPNMQDYDAAATKTDISKVSTRESQEQMMRIVTLHNQGAWDDWKTRNASSHGKKDDRRRKTASVYEAHGIDSLVLPGEEENLGQMGHFAFARGPVRTSYHSRK